MSTTKAASIILSVAVAALAIYLQWPLQTIAPVLQTIFPGTFDGRAIAHDAAHNISWIGTIDDGIELFQSVFYAEDTGGSNRFKPPVLLEHPRDTRLDASVLGDVCPQGRGDAVFPFTSPTFDTSEDCLSLQVGRPLSTKASAKLPVMVYLHGGGDILGAGSDQLYRPHGLIKQSVTNKQPVIFIGVNYRLGIFGFAASEALKTEKSMNNGLRDQRTALEWIKKHIDAFGGDPDRITAVGQSVGATSIALHLASYAGSRGVPFERAIAMSGAFGQNFDIGGKIVSSNTAKVAETVGCLQKTSTDVLACLRKKPMRELEDASIALARSLHPPFGEYSFYPQLDGDYLPERPSVLYRKGQFVKDIPTITSWNTNDGAWYAPADIAGDEAIGASFAAYAPGLTPESQRKLVSQYPASQFRLLQEAYPQTTVDYWRAAQLQRDTWFTCPGIVLAWRQAQHGTTGKTANVRLYENNATKFAPVLQTIGFPYWRVLHLSDVPLLLNNDVPGSAVPLDNGAANAAVARDLSSAAIAFAYGDERAEALREWPQAFEGVEKNLLKDDFPSRISLKVFGGSHGSEPVEVTDDMDHDTSLSERDRAVRWEDLLSRCRFIDSIADEIGV